MPGLTISSQYGAGGNVIAPRVAEALGFRLLDRTIDGKVAEELQVSLEEAEKGERKQSFADRFFAALAPLADTVTGDPEILASARSGATEEFRVEASKLMEGALADGAVILGRGGAAALHGTHPEVLRVRLYGDPELRVIAAVKYYDADEATARERQHRTDEARAKYVQHLYGRDINDSNLYHLELNTPLFELDQCVDVIVGAYRAFAAASAAA
ncbi:AAA family ATPase [Flexivirga caeni]|uniref:Cytidylate kinase-like family protein n=1 Tax=Flexivirga caeni TaxID=2294115 RepID=A0A3M9M9P2_9MICO|nr:cytidylate kinase-like family protein [Flexivirga caeni]RNI21278.1 cytidylate kinase-like family protein [Flexivirga caeni]